MAVTILWVKINGQKKAEKFKVFLILGKGINFKYIMWISEKTRKNRWCCNFRKKSRSFRV